VKNEFTKKASKKGRILHERLAGLKFISYLCIAILIAMATIGCGSA
jgi:hypothetical protein